MVADFERVSIGRTYLVWITPRRSASDALVAVRIRHDIGQAKILRPLPLYPLRLWLFAHGQMCPIFLRLLLKFSGGLTFVIRPQCSQRVRCFSSKSFAASLY